MSIPSPPARPVTGQPEPTRNRTVDPLPKSVLHKLVGDLPGPPDETDAARAARFEAQLAEVLSYKPRDIAEAMMATQCIMMRLVADHARQCAIRAAARPAEAIRHQRDASQLDKLFAKNQRMLADFQTRPRLISDAVMFAALRLNAYLVPDPAPVPDDTEEAFSAVIVPLHPAPKTLQ